MVWVEALGLESRTRRAQPIGDPSKRRGRTGWLGPMPRLGGDPSGWAARSTASGEFNRPTTPKTGRPRWPKRAGPPAMKGVRPSIRSTTGGQPSRTIFLERRRVGLTRNQVAAEDSPRKRTKTAPGPFDWSWPSSPLDSTPSKRLQKRNELQFEVGTLKL